MEAYCSRAVRRGGLRMSTPFLHTTLYQLCSTPVCMLLTEAHAQAYRPGDQHHNEQKAAEPRRTAAGPSGGGGARMNMPFSAASHRSSPPKMSSSFCLSLPEKMTTVVLGSAHSALTQAYTVGLMRVHACTQAAGESPTLTGLILVQDRTPPSS